jgi:hypothetical protein
MYLVMLATTQDAPLHRVPTKRPDVRSGVLAVVLTLTVMIAAVYMMRRVRRLLD